MALSDFWWVAFLFIGLQPVTWTHDYAITAEEAKSLGLPVTTEMPPEVYELMRLFPQPTRTRPSVEYVPVPYRSRRSPETSGPPRWRRPPSVGAADRCRRATRNPRGAPRRPTSS